MNIQELYNNVLNYWWPKEEDSTEHESQEKKDLSPIARITRLRKLMKDSNYSEIHKEQICNYYSKLIKEYPSSQSTFQYPSFLYEPDIYQPKICFFVPLILNYLEVKGNIDLYILFQEELSKNMPQFYIRNPNYSKSKPNKKEVSFGPNNEESKFYQAVMGGVKIVLPEVQAQKWSWTAGDYYKEDNIVNMVRWIHKKLLLDHFPFLKRNKERQDSAYPESKALKQCMSKTMYPIEGANIAVVPLLSNIQDYQVLQLSIDSQIKELYQENVKLKQLQQLPEEQLLQYFVPVPTDRRSEHLLEGISRVQALRDTQVFFEVKFYNSEVSLDDFMKLSKKLMEEEFEEMVKISFLEVPQIL